MIHPSITAPPKSKTKKEAAEDLISFWKEKDIYVKSPGYLEVLLMLAYLAGIFLLDTPYKIFLQIGFVVLILLMIRQSWLSKKRHKSSLPSEDPIEHVRIQKEKMIARRAYTRKLIYWGFPLIMILKISSFYLYSPNESWGEIALFAGVFLVVGIAAIIINRGSFVQPISDADKVLSMED